MQLYMPTFLTNLGTCFRNHATPEAANRAKNISAVAAIKIGVAALLYCFFMKMREIDKKNPPENISSETLSVCSCGLIFPGATWITRQVMLMKQGFDSIKTGWQTRNPRQMTKGLVLSLGTYLFTTRLFNRYRGVEGFFDKY